MMLHGFADLNDNVSCPHFLIEEITAATPYSLNQHPNTALKAWPMSPATGKHRSLPVNRFRRSLTGRGAT